MGNLPSESNQVGLLHAHTGAAGAGLPPLLLLALLCRCSCLTGSQGPQSGEHIG